MSNEYDAVVVGSGPNGLAAAITLARTGLSVLVLEANSTIGGGARSAELTLPGFVHDICSAVHPLAAGSPFFKTLPLERFGLSWIEPEIPLAHPLDNETAACLHRDVDVTAHSLGEDGPAYRNMMKPLARDWENLSAEFLQPILHLPRHPIALGRFGIRAMCPTTLLSRISFKKEAARALFAGIAAHSFLPLESPVSSAFALVLGAAGHAVGWPIPRGGSQSISNALADYFRARREERHRPADRELEGTSDVARDTFRYHSVAVRSHCARSIATPLSDAARKFPARAGNFQNRLRLVFTDTVES